MQASPASQQGQKIVKEQRVNSVVNPLKAILKEFEIRETEGAREFLGFAFPDLPDFNCCCSGLRKGCLSILGSAPGRGKANLLLELAISVIKANKIPVLYFSFNDSPRELLYQLLARESELDMETLQFKKIMGVGERKEKLKVALDRFAKFQSYLHIIPGSNDDTVDHIKTLVEQTKARYKVRDVAVFIDSLQRIPYKGSSVAKRDIIESQANGLKLLSLSLDIPVFVTSQVRGEGIELDSREGADRLVFTHCRGSEELSQFADFGLVLSYSYHDTMELSQQLRNKAEALGMDVNLLPWVEVLDLHFDCAPSNVPHNSCVQFLLLKDSGRMIELGFYQEQIHRFNRLDKVLNQLIESGELKFREFDPLAANAPAASAAASETMDIPGMPPAAAASKPKPKISIKLKK